MKSVPHRISHSYDELLSITTKLRNDVVAQSEGLRWCWIAEWHREAQGYALGVQYEGKSRCDYKPVIIQFGRGPAAYELMDRLNAREGLTKDASWTIRCSGMPQATAMVSTNGSQVQLRLKGVDHSIEPGLLGEKQCIFVTDEELVRELFFDLLEIRYNGLLPRSSGIADVEVVDDEHGDRISVSCPGIYAVDPADDYLFTLTISLRTAADLCNAIPERLLC